MGGLFGSGGLEDFSGRFGGAGSLKERLVRLVETDLLARCLLKLSL